MIYLNIHLCNFSGLLVKLVITNLVTLVITGIGFHKIPGLRLAHNYQLESS